MEHANNTLGACLLKVNCARRTHLAGIVIALILALGVTACVPTNPGNANMSNIHKIKENTQFTYNDLRIGVAGIHPDQYVAADGRQTQGLVAGFWLYLASDPKLDRQEWVWPGKRVAIGKYVVDVVSVADSAVEIKIAP